MFKVVFISIASLVWLAGCSREMPAVAEGVAVIRLPELPAEGQASCSLIGGFPSHARQLDGSLVSVCTLPNGKRCGENALSAGACG